MAHSITRYRRGFTLTEIAIVLAIIGVIIGAIWTAAANVFANNRADQAVQDISTMAQNIRSSYMATNSFASAPSMATLITAGIVPSDLYVSGATTATDAWNGAVTITLGSTDARHFRIMFNNTPQDACFRIASQLANLGTSDAPVNLITNTTNVVPIGTSGSTIGLSSAAVNTACALNSGSAAASTGFDYTIH